jgi:hypothetical protein
MQTNIHADHHQGNDKVLVRVEDRNRRAVLIGAPSATAQVRFDDDGSEDSVPIDAVVRNFSLAWRRATRQRTQHAARAAATGQPLPRRGGRPTTNKESISIRVREDLWRILGDAAAAGLIVSREQVLDTMLESLVTILQPQLANLAGSSQTAELEEPGGGAT